MKNLSDYLTPGQAALLLLLASDLDVSSPILNALKTSLKEDAAATLADLPDDFRNGLLAEVGKAIAPFLVNA